jgi:glycosyltransferase involved in cell wall biosynthesis
MISLLHPSLKRPDRSKATIEKWVANAGTEIEVIVSLDSTDPNLKAYQEIHKGRKIVLMENRNAIQAINLAAKNASGDILIVVSDDTDCPQLWGKKILEAVVNRRDWIMKTTDGIQKWIITMPVMDRAYYNRFGYIYYPEYQHMFCDTELTHVADLLKRVIKREYLFFPHKHYSVTKAKRDDVSIQADSTWDQGKQLYLQRVREKFGLKGVDVMNISDNNHFRWLKQNLR